MQIIRGSHKIELTPDETYNYPEPDKNSYEQYDDWNDIER